MAYRRRCNRHAEDGEFRSGFNIECYSVAAIVAVPSRKFMTRIIFTTSSRGSSRNSLLEAVRSSGSGALNVLSLIALLRLDTLAKRLEMQIKKIHNQAKLFICEFS
jgi:hypothetical protein